VTMSTLKNSRWVAVIASVCLIVVAVLYILSVRARARQDELLTDLRTKAQQRDALCAELQSQLTFVIMDIQEHTKDPSGGAAADVASARVVSASANPGDLNTLLGHCGATISKDEWLKCSAKKDDACLVRMLNDAIEQLRQGRWAGKK
jgi:predicted protein tyrosine phosphatase